MITVTGTVTGGTTYAVAQSIALTVAGSGNAYVVVFSPVTGVMLSVPAAASESVISFTLTPSDNDIDEAAETITISSTSPLVSNAATLTLHDDDGSPTIRLRASPTSVNEGDGAITVTVTATSSAPFTDARLLPVTVMGSGEAAAVDYAPIAAFDLTLPANETTADGIFMLTPADDQVDEVEEILLITSPDPLVLDSAAVVLYDNDPAPDGVVLSAVPAFIDEGAGPTTVTVTATVRGSTVYGINKQLNLQWPVPECRRRWTLPRCRTLC